MTTRAIARSISRRIHGWQSRQSSARAFFVSDQACNLLLDRGDVLSIVAPHVGNGPFNIVVDDPDDLVGLPIQAHADYGLTLTRDGLYLDTFRIDLQRAQTWEPCPDWGSDDSAPAVPFRFARKPASIAP